jgi:hypothetical protein
VAAVFNLNNVSRLILGITEDDKKIPCIGADSTSEDK